MTKKRLSRHVATLLLVLSPLGASLLGAERAPASPDYSACASSTYTQLKNAWAASVDSPNFWMVGNVFDTMIDYILLYEDDPQKELAAIAPTAKALYENSLATNACWWDDLSWWGIASAKMSKYIDDPSEKEAFKKIAVYLWDTIHTYAHSVYSRAEEGPNKKYFQPMQPRFGGGIWNYCWGRDGDPAKCWPKQGSACSGGCDPTGDDHLCGYQNTVTNSLHLVLSLRLYQLETDATEKEHYLQEAKAQFNWFRSWFGVSDPKATLLPGQDGGGMLVRERAGTYYDTSWVNSYDPKTFWAGDQGIVLGGLVDYFMAEPGDTYPQTVAVGIVKAVRSSMTDHDNYLQPWNPADGDLCQWDCGDYSCGPGVFMRYLQYAFQNNKEVQSEVRKHAKDFVRTNADRACKGGPQNYCTLCDSSSGYEPDMFRLLNYMATLNAAKVILD